LADGHLPHRIQGVHFMMKVIEAAMLLLMPRLVELEEA
jgi:hypothetical protein